MAKEGSDITLRLCSEAEVGRSVRQTVLWLPHCQPWCQRSYHPQKRGHTRQQKGQPAPGLTVMETRTDSCAFSIHFVFITFSSLLMLVCWSSRSCFCFVKKCKFLSNIYMFFGFVSWSAQKNSRYFYENERYTGYGSSSRTNKPLQYNTPLVLQQNLHTHAVLV